MGSVGVTELCRVYPQQVRLWRPPSPLHFVFLSIEREKGDTGRRTVAAKRSFFQFILSQVACFAETASPTNKNSRCRTTGATQFTVHPTTRISVLFSWELNRTLAIETLCAEKKSCFRKLMNRDADQPALKNSRTLGLNYVDTKKCTWTNPTRRAPPPPPLRFPAAGGT